MRDGGKGNGLSLIIWEHYALTYIVVWSITNYNKW